MINNWNTYKNLENIGDKILKSAAQILNETGEQMMDRSTDVYEPSKVVNTKKYTWKDIVKIDGQIYCEEFPISGVMDDPNTYCIGDFMKAVAEKYNCDTDDIQTYMLDGIEFDPSVLSFGAEACGCYINGIPEWVTDGWMFDSVVR